MVKAVVETDGQMAERYNEASDVSDFDGVTEPVEVRRNVTISVRFSADEIATLRSSAEAVGMKVTAFIRGAAVGAERPPLDYAALAEAAAVAEHQLHQIRASLGVRPSGAGGSGKFEVYTDRAGKFRFRLKAANREVVAVGGPYASKAAALQAIDAMQLTAANAAV